MKGTEETWCKRLKTRVRAKVWGRNFSTKHAADGDGGGPNAQMNKKKWCGGEWVGVWDGRKENHA